MNYTRADIINALCAEWDYLCHDDFDPENDQTTEEYREELQNYSLEELIENSVCPQRLRIFTRLFYSL